MEDHASQMLQYFWPEYKKTEQDSSMAKVNKCYSMLT